MNRKARVLLAHDENNMVGAINVAFGRKFRNLDVEHDESGGGKKGLLAVIKKSKPDIVFFNPSRIGETEPEPVRNFCRDLRRKHRHLRIILMTGWTSFYQLRSIDVLADGLIFVPEKIEVFVSAIRLHLPFAM